MDEKSVSSLVSEFSKIIRFLESDSFSNKDAIVTLWRLTRLIEMLLHQLMNDARILDSGEERPMSFGQLYILVSEKKILPKDISQELSSIVQVRNMAAHGVFFAGKYAFNCRGKRICFKYTALVSYSI